MSLFLWGVAGACAGLGALFAVLAAEASHPSARRDDPPRSIHLSRGGSLRSPLARYQRELRRAERREWVRENMRAGGGLR